MALNVYGICDSYKFIASLLKEILCFIVLFVCREITNATEANQFTYVFVCVCYLLVLYIYVSAIVETQFSWNGAGSLVSVAKYNTERVRLMVD